MGILSIVIKKVAEQASKVVLFGALVGGVSLASYATETPVGPTIEKAQLETVDINLDAVVAAITKADPDWMKGLPKLKEAVKPKAVTLETYGVIDLIPATGSQPAKLILTTNPVGTIGGFCGDEDYPCRITFDTEDVTIQYDDDGRPYVEEDDDYDASPNKGPYSATP